MKGAVQRKKISARPQSKAPDIDRQIGRLARKGAFLKCGLVAIEEALKAGRTATILEGNTVIRLHPDGTKEVVKKLEAE